MNGRRKSNQRSRYWPNRPRRPKEKNSATPPTTGGSTIDSVHSARTTPRPGELDPRQQPGQRHAEHERDTPVAHSEQRSTATARCARRRSVSTSQAALHGARHSSPTNGSAKKAMRRRTASASAGAGRRSPSAGAVRRRRSCARAPVVTGRRSRRSARIAWPSLAEHEVDERRGRRRGSPRSAVTTIGYSAMTLMSAGISTPSASVAGGHDVGAVDDAGVGLAERRPW